jgi:hypothetical protein
MFLVQLFFFCSEYIECFPGIKIAVFWVVAPCSLVEVYETTRRYNPEDSHLRTHRRENLKSYFPGIVYRYFLSPLVTISVAPMITGMTKHFMFHIR